MSKKIYEPLTVEKYLKILEQKETMNRSIFNIEKQGCWYFLTGEDLLTGNNWFAYLTEQSMLVFDNAFKVKVKELNEDKVKELDEVLKYKIKND